MNIKNQIEQAVLAIKEFNVRYQTIVRQGNKDEIKAAQEEYTMLCEERNRLMAEEAAPFQKAISDANEIIGRGTEAIRDAGYLTARDEAEAKWDGPVGFGVAVRADRD